MNRHPDALPVFLTKETGEVFDLGMKVEQHEESQGSNERKFLMTGGKQELVVENFKRPPPHFFSNGHVSGELVSRCPSF